MNMDCFSRKKCSALVLLLFSVFLKPSTAGTSTVVFYNVYPADSQWTLRYSNQICIDPQSTNLTEWREITKVNTSSLAYGTNTSFTTTCDKLIFDIFDAGGNVPENLEMKMIHVLDTDFINMVGVEMVNGEASMSSPKPLVPPWSVNRDRVVNMMVNSYDRDCQVYIAAGVQWLEGEEDEPYTLNISGGMSIAKTCQDTLRKDSEDTSEGCEYLSSSAVRFKCGGETAQTEIQGDTEWCLNAVLLVVASGISGSSAYPLRLTAIAADPTACVSSCSGLLANSFSQCKNTLSGPFISESQPSPSSVVFFNLFPAGDRYFFTYPSSDACGSQAAFLEAREGVSLLKTGSLLYDNKLSINTTCTNFFFQVVREHDITEMLGGPDHVFNIQLIDSDHVNLIGLILGPSGEPALEFPRAQQAPWSVHSDKVAYEIANYYGSHCEVVVGGSQEYVEAAIPENNNASFVRLPPGQYFSAQKSCQEVLKVDADDTSTVHGCDSEYATKLVVRVRCQGVKATKYEDISMHDHLCVNSNLLIAIHGIVGDATHPMEVSLVSGDPFPFIMCQESCSDVLFKETNCEEYKRWEMYPDESFSVPLIQSGVLLIVLMTLNFILFQMTFV